MTNTPMLLYRSVNKYKTNLNEIKIQKNLGMKNEKINTVISIFNRNIESFCSLKKLGTFLSVPGRELTVEMFLHKEQSVTSLR